MTAPAVRVWDTARGQDYRLLAPALKTFTAHPSRPEVAVASGKEIAFYHPATGAKLRAFAAAPEDVAQLAYSPDGLRLATASWDRTVKVWNSTLSPQRTLSALTDRVQCVAISPDGKVLASGGHDRMVRLWDLASFQDRSALKGHAEVINTLAFDRSGATLASGSSDRTVKMWNLALELKAERSVSQRTR